MAATTVLLDTGNSVSLMPAWQARALKVEVTPRSDIIIRGTDGRRLAVDGTRESEGGHHKRRIVDPYKSQGPKEVTPITLELSNFPWHWQVQTV